MLFGDKILDYFDDILKDLGELVAIPSVCGKPEGKYPFGKEPARAIDTALRLAEGYGLRTKNVDYYACHAEIGEGEGNAVVMAHLDVVPEGEGWESDPYTLTERDGLLFGRGVSDNKSPAVVAMHCLRALKDAGVQGKRKLRVVMGSAEEIGMADMEHYFASEQAPDMGFTPDSAYGICNCEKGILHFVIAGQGTHPAVKSFRSGTVVNAVPYKAEAHVACSEAQLAVLQEAAYKLAGEFTVTKEDGGAYILSKGVAGHASNPDSGVNAAAHLIDLLCSVFGDSAGTLLQFANRKIGFSTDGTPMGINCADEQSGKLTFNLGLVNIEGDKNQFSIDIRFPSTAEGQPIADAIRKQAEEAGLTMCDIELQRSVYIPADGPFISMLSSAYEDVTGEKCDVFSMGGGTYAKQMGGKGVAFGASFKNSDSFAHNCNERINVEELKLHARICLEAMYRMYTMEDPQI